VRGKFSGVTVVVLTGATRGIGRAAAIELARRGADVALVGRDPERVTSVAEEATAAGGGGQVHGHVADLALMSNVRVLAEEIRRRYEHIDVLANNAGALFASRKETPEGFEQTFALNHLAPFLLTNLLLDRLKASAPSRAVTVSSGAQAAGRIDFDDLQGARSYSGQRAYSQSKLANILFTNELARRLQGSGVTANSVHPGVVRTNFASEDQAAFFQVISPLVRPFLKTPTQGARTPIYLASSLDVEAITGQFFANRKPKAPSKVAGDVDVTARLWRVSTDLVGLTGSPR
jgi:NAD(P)-dependent dehydrogenase (short-subunit alcohol dehydrogenase family)